MDAMQTRFSGRDLDEVEAEAEAMSDTVPRGGGPAFGGFQEDKVGVEGTSMKLQVIVDVVCGTAQVISGDPAAVAGLEVLCHGRRMVLLPNASASDARWGLPPRF